MEYGLIRDPSTDISNDDLKDVVKDLRQHQPFCGVSMVWGNLRSKVTRERVRNTLRQIDPIGRMLRFLPGSIRRQPYSVPGPNSLWHMGKCSSEAHWGIIGLLRPCLHCSVFK